MQKARFDKNVYDKNKLRSDVKNTLPGSQILRSSKRELTEFKFLTSNMLVLRNQVEEEKETEKLQQNWKNDQNTVAEQGSNLDPGTISSLS